MQINKVYRCNNLAGFRHMDDNFVDLTVTSPPYDKLRYYNGAKHNWKKVIEELYRVTKKKGVVVWIVADQSINNSETGTSFRQAIYAQKCGFKLHDTMIWQKPSFSMPSANRYHQVFEYMFIFSKGGVKTFNLIKDRKNKWECNALGNNTKRNYTGELEQKQYRKKPEKYGARFNVWYHKTAAQERPCKKIKHHAVFPYGLAYDHILSWSNENDLILDPYAGSGTTLFAAQDLSRNYIGFEINKEHVKDIRRGLKWKKLRWL